MGPYESEMRHALAHNARHMGNSSINACGRVDDDDDSDGNSCN